MMVICINQHLSNIWSSIHEKVKQRWGWVEKTRCLQKKRVLDDYNEPAGTPYLFFLLEQLQFNVNYKFNIICFLFNVFYFYLN